MQHLCMFFVFSSEDFFNLATTEIRVVTSVAESAEHFMTWCYKKLWLDFPAGLPDGKPTNVAWVQFDTGIFMEILGNSKVFNGIDLNCYLNCRFWRVQCLIPTMTNNAWCWV